MRSTTPYLIPILIAAALAGAVGLATAQEFDRASFYLRDIRPALQQLESVSPRHLDGDTPATPTFDGNYQFEMNPGELILLRRNFTRSLIDSATNPLQVAFQEDLKTEAELSIGSRLGLNFSSTETQVKDLRGLALDTRQSKVMGLRHSFGGGEAASALSLRRTVTTQTPYLGLATTTRLEELEFKSGLTADHDLSLKALRSESDAPGAPREINLQGVFTTRFSGGDGPMSFARNEKIVNGLETVTEKIDLLMPFAANGSKGILEHHSAFTQAGTALTKTRTSHFMLPTKLLGEMGLVDYAIVGENKGLGLVESRTARLVNPFKIGGKTIGLEESLVTVDQPTGESETLLMKLTAPLAGGQAVVQRQTVTVTTPTGETEQEQLALISPTIKVSDRMSVMAQRVSTELEGVSDQDVTNVNVSVSPTKPWQLDARYSVDDKGPLTASRTRQLHSKYALGSKLMLEGHLTEAQAPGVENSLRLIEVVRDRGDSGIGVRAGFASYEALNQEIDAGRRVEVCAGKPGGLAITAAYSEYDPASWTRFADDQTVALSVQHGDPNDMALRWRYEDQPTRVEPLQAVDLAMGALGGKLQVSYQNNPVGPDGKTVRQAEQYEASLGRKLFGDVNLQLGFRYLDYATLDLVDQHYRVQLDGGNEARGGKVALGYFTGDFCPPTGTSEPLPGSKLDVTYSRLWGDQGKLTLTLQRKTAPVNTLLDGTTEGRLEYSRIF